MSRQGEGGNSSPNTKLTIEMRRQNRFSGLVCLRIEIRSTLKASALLIAEA